MSDLITFFHQFLRERHQGSGRSTRRRRGRSDHARGVPPPGERLQQESLLSLEAVPRTLTGGAVQPDIGHVVESPLPLLIEIGIMQERAGENEQDDGFLQVAEHQVDGAATDERGQHRLAQDFNDDAKGRAPAGPRQLVVPLGLQTGLGIGCAETAEQRRRSRVVDHVRTVGQWFCERIRRMLAGCLGRFSQLPRPGSLITLSSFLSA